METLKCNQIIYKEDLIKDPDLLDYIKDQLDYIKDQLDANVGRKIVNSLINNGISICRANTKEYKLLDINAVNIIDTVQITKLIRCKDCANWDTEWTPSSGDGSHYCPMIDLVTNDAFYCAASSERKEENEKIN